MLKFNIVNAVENDADEDIVQEVKASLRLGQDGWLILEINGYNVFGISPEGKGGLFGNIDPKITGLQVRNRGRIFMI